MYSERYSLRGRQAHGRRRARRRASSWAAFVISEMTRQTDRQLFSGPVPHPPRRFYVAPPPYTHTRGCAPGGSPIGWAVLLLTSTSRARTRRAPRTARALAVQDGLGAWGGEGPVTVGCSEGVNVATAYAGF